MHRLWQRSVWSLLIVAGGFLNSGCAVLTKSQVQAVKAFARAAENYGPLPGEPIRIYAAVDHTDRLLIVAARNFSEPAAREKGWEELNRANASSAAFGEVATAADRTLDILNTYARLLTVLSSDQFTDALEVAARSLGRSLDQAIDRYNDRVRKPRGESSLGPIGGAVAALVRGSGGIWIRHRQAEYLRAYVTAAQPVIGSLTVDVRTLLAEHVGKDLDALESRFQQDFETTAGRLQTLPLDTLKSVADAQAQIRIARKLCRSAATAATEFSAAHTKLAQALAERQTLTSRIAEIEVLADEIDEARKLAGEFGK